jgi:multiple sugar transport system substrate-binding protein
MRGKSFKHRFLFLLLVCIGLALIVAPALIADDGKPYAGQSLRVLHDKRPNTQKLLSLLPEFEAATGIKVTVDIMPESEVFPKETIELSQQVGTYDVMQYIWLFQPGWEKAGWLIDLAPYISDSSKNAFDWKEADFDGSMLGILSVNNKQLGIPFITFTNGLIYNDILLKKYKVKPPTTIAEFEQAAKKMTVKDPEYGQIYGYMARGGRRGTEDTNSWVQVLKLFGGNFFDSNWKCTLNKPEAVRATEWYAKMLNLYAPPGAKRAGWTDVVTEFNQGRVAMIMEGFVVWEQYNDPKQSKIAGHVGLAPLPDSPTRGRAVGGAWGLGIPNTSKHKDAAWQYIQWLTGTPVAKRLLLATTKEANLAVYQTSPNPPGAPPLE